MQLTEAGLKLDAQVRQGLSVLEQAFAPPRKASKASKQVVISSVSSIASTWLFSRLSEFRAEHPDTEFDLRVADGLSDYKKEGIDLGVRLGRGGWAGMHATKLFDEALTPVCAPTYRERFDLQTPTDLQRATLLRNPWTPWARWFRAVGLDWPEPASGPMFDHAPLLLRAALDGQGVALGRQWLAIDEIRAGRLVTPFDLAIRDDFAYWLVWPTGRTLSADASRFRDWLDARAAAEEAPCPIQVV